MTDDSFREFPAPARLRHQVLSLWIHRTDVAVVRRAVPDGSAHIVCPIGAPAEFVGPAVAPTMRTVPAHTTVVGARLRPGAHWQGIGDELGERLAEARSGRAALTVLARCLDELPRWERSDPIVAASVEALLLDPRTSLDAVVAGSSLSGRQWRRHFIAETGMGPKTLQRLLRFQLVLQQVQAGLGRSQTPLARIAATVGYFDQAHFTHECVRLTGVTPTSFVEQTALRCGENHDHSAAFSMLRS